LVSRKNRESLVAVLAGFALGACGSTSPKAAKPSAAGGAGGTGSVVIPIVGAGGCADIPDLAASDAGPDPLCAGTSAEISFQQNVLPLVHCSGEVCHQAWTYGTLAGRASHACCDGRPLVSPGRPSASHLVQAIRDVDSCVGRMGDLDAEQIAIVVAWVCEGAPDN
jgi:hypothetical protein